MTLRELTTKWGFEVDDAPLKNMEKQLDAIKSRLDVLTGIEIVKALSEMVERFSKFGEELHIAAESAGITVESFQKLAFAANQSSISNEELETSMFRLSRRLNDARMGSAEAIKAFGQLGISSSQIASFHTSRDALYAIADRLRVIQDPIKKAALAQELLGRGSKHMVGFLSQGSAAMKEQGDEAERLGLVLSGDQVEALVDLEHALQKIWALFKAVGAVIAADVAPVFKYLIDDFIKFFGANRDFVQLNVENTLGNIAYAMGFLWEAVKFLFTDFVRLAKAFHIEGDILPAIVAFASLVGMFKLYHGVVNTVIGAYTGFIKVVEVATSVVEFFEGVFLAPWFPVVAAIAAVIFAVHELYAMFTGKATWTDQFLDWLSSLNLIQKALGVIKDVWGFIKGGLSADLGVFKNFMGFGSNDQSANATSPLNQIGQLAAAGPDVSNNNVAGGNYAVNAPIEINVPAGTSHEEVGKHVQDGVREHLDKVYRETQRGTLNPVQY